MEVFNDFSNGMNSDISKLKESPNTALQYLNFRPLTELGGSNGSVVNIKGNKCTVKFPDLQAVYKLRINITNAAIGGNTTTITINGQTTASININASTTGKMLYDAIKLLNNCYQTTNGTPATPTFAVAYQDDYVIIYQQPVYTTCSIIPSVTPTITITPSGGAVNTVKFEDKDGNLSATQITLGPPVKNWYVVPGTASKDLVIIGHTFILDDIYLFTAPDDPSYGQTNNVPLSDSTTYPGHIWKLNYNETTDVSTLTLIYSALLDFTKYFPIAPSAATGRYESDPIQRIYWSDFYNKIKTINVANPQLMAVNPKLIALIPSVGFDIPIFTDIISGSLFVGSYELCYRLTQNLGAVTNYSSISNIVNLTDGTFGNWISTEGNPAGTNSNKGIRWTLSNLDTSYDNVEIVALFRDTQTNLPVIYDAFKTTIPLSGTVVYDLTTLNDLDQIDLLTFLTLASTFTHAKTVDTKDNRLWWGNVKVKTGDLNYDARAFRAKTANANSTDIYLINNGTQAAYTLTQAKAFAETEDTINQYYDPVTGNHDANACYFQPDNAGGILGGKGTNISYQFKTVDFQLNNLLGTGTGDLVGNISGDLPYRYTNIGTPTSRVLLTSTNDSPNQFYNFSSSPDSMKFPYRSSLLRGFQHEEIYRFGIQFFDLEGNPYFVKWIGDIKFPAYGDSNPTGPTGDFRMSYASGAGINGQALAIEFTIDVTSIADQISGYKIVRVERPDTQKTIMGCGIMTPTYIHDGTDVSNGDSTQAYMPANFLGYRELFPPVALRAGQSMYPWPSSYACDQLNADSTATHLDAKAAKVKTFDSFDIELNGGLSYSSGDRLFLRSKLAPRNYRGTVGQGFIKSDTFGGVSNNNDWLTNNHVTGVTAGPYWCNHVTPGAGNLDGGANQQTGFDTGEQPYYLHMYEDNTVYVGTTTGNAISDANYIRTLTGTEFVLLNNSSSPLASGVTYNNWGRAYATNNPLANTPIGNFGANDKTCYGARTLVCDLNTAGYYEDSAPYGCVMAANNKITALYYRPRPNQYGGPDYNARSLSEYISCGSYIPIKRDNKTLPNNPILTQLVYGGDVYQCYWDHQKAIKSEGASPVIYNYYPQFPATGIAGEVGSLGGPSVSSGIYQVSVTYFFPCTTYNNMEVRYGDHINTQLNVNTYATEDADLCERYHTNERNEITYFPKPVNFVTTDTWVNRIFYSEVKTNNELQDSWQAYKANNFYDVEGNYGPINCVMALKQKLYFIQERGLGFLYINPITAITGTNGLPVTLGKGSTVERHDYISLDVGTKHQWSVSKSQNNMTWLDIRSKRLYIFNGESLAPISDSLGQRNFVIKRCHPDLLIYDNPIIYKGVHSTFDYFNNEFLYTFINGKDVIPDPVDPTSVVPTTTENYTLAYSEAINKFSGLYSFVPNLYLNNNRYLFSIDPLRDNTSVPLSIWLHNFGNYSTFYSTIYPSQIKTIINPNPSYTKVFDNLQWQTESINDNISWIDDLVTTNSNISNTYSDNINILNDTFNSIRVYNEYQNSDWTTLVVDTNVKKREQTWATYVPRNKVNYDILTPSTSTIFNPAVLTKLDFGERIRDKYMVLDLKYDNLNNRRFIAHNLKTEYRISPR